MNFLKRLILAPLMLAAVVFLTALVSAVIILGSALLCTALLAVVGFIFAVLVVAAIRGVFTGKPLSASVDALKTAVEGKLASA